MNTETLEQAYLSIHTELMEISEKKHHDYGPDSITPLGLRGVYVRIWDKVARLKNLIWENREAAVEDETVEDTLMDLANYAIIALLVKRGKWGLPWK